MLCVLGMFLSEAQCRFVPTVSPPVSFFHSTAGGHVVLSIHKEDVSCDRWPNKFKTTGGCRDQRSSL